MPVLDRSIAIVAAAATAALAPSPGHAANSERAASFVTDVQLPAEAPRDASTRRDTLPRLRGGRGKDTIVVLPQVAVAASAPRRWAPLAAARLRRDDLVAADPESMRRHARALAGATFREDRVYVDGMPSTRLPAREAIAELTINDDPFSVLYTESDQNVIEITSAAPDRSIRWSGSRTSRSYGGHNPLAPQLRSRRRFGEARMTAPVPFTALALSVDAMEYGVSEHRPVVGPAMTDAAVTDVARVGGTSRFATLGLAGRVRAASVRISVTSARSVDVGLEAGGFVRPERSPEHLATNHETRLSAEIPLGTHRYRTGLVVRDGRQSFAATATGPALTILETRVAGGASFRSLRHDDSEWRWQSILVSPRSASTIGWSLARAVEGEALVPNADGQRVFGTLDEYERWLGGDSVGTWMRARPLITRVASTTAALFGQREFQLSPATVLRPGLRADYRSGDGVLLAPRIALVTAWRRARIMSGIGVFRQQWSNAVLLQAQRYGPESSDGVDAHALIGSSESGDARPLRSTIDPSFARPGALVLRHGVSYGNEGFTAGGDYAWTVGFFRPGSRRFADGAAWLDRLESNRRLRRHQLHGRLGYALASASVVAHYEWVRSHDDSEGPFSFPERQQLLAAEWARSSGVSPHNVAIVASLPTVGGIAASLIFTARSPAPLNIRTGRDSEGTRLYGDRGGARRNDGRGPTYSSVDGYASRRLNLPYVRFGDRATFVDVALVAENLLGARNYSTIGSVRASPFFGQPVAALPGRSARVSFAVGR